MPLTPSIGDVMLISFNFPPKGWAFCNGQLLPINQNQALFSILGTTYGGNGQTNFGLPDLRGRIPIHWGSGISIGQRAGQEFHTLIASELPGHTHFVTASSASADQKSPANNLPAANSGRFPYGSSADTAMNGGSIVGGGQAHENRPPYLVLNYVIALVGVFPSRN